MGNKRKKGQSEPAASAPTPRWTPGALVGLVVVTGGVAALAWFFLAGGDSTGNTETTTSSNDAAPAVPAGNRIDPDLEVVEALPGGPGSLSDCSLLLVTLDTTRADHLRCYGNERVETPTMDRLAEEGVIFSSASAVAPLTMPSHASILTGLYPAHHGVRTNGFFRLHDEQVTLAERLKSAGFKTGAFVSSFVLDSQFGLAQGFDHYDDDMSDAADPVGGHHPSLTANKTTERALEWMRETAGKRFFLWVHYFDPHHDYAPPGEYAKRYAKSPYDGEIAFVDSQIKRLTNSLESLGLTDKCLTVIVGDHGEGLGEHDEPTHGYLGYESTINVPLIMHCGSRLGGGVHYEQPVSQVDIMPSVLDLFGLDPEPGDGAALTEAVPRTRPVFFEALAGTFEYGWEPLLGVRTGDLKYIHCSAPEMYDLAHDPREADRAAFSHQGKGSEEEGNEMRKHLATLFGSDLALSLETDPTLQPSAKDLENLQALGYMGGGGSDESQGPRNGIPREMIQLLNRVEVVRNGGMPYQAQVAEFKSIIEDHPDFYPAWKGLGQTYYSNGELEPGAEALTECLRLKPGTPRDVFGLAAIRENQKRLAEAVDLIEPLLEEYPDYLRARHLYATLLDQLGKTQESATEFKKVFDSAPDFEHWACTKQMVAVFQKAGRSAEIETLLERYLDGQPGSSEARQILATHLAQTKYDMKAAALLREGLKLDPKDVQLTNSLAILLFSSGDPAVRDVDAAASLLEPFAVPGAEEPQLMYTLCAVYGNTGRGQEAMSIAQRARALALKQGNLPLVEAFDRHLNQ